MGTTIVQAGEEGVPRDPFPAAPSVAAYIPRPATEQLLAYLEAKLLAGPCLVDLEGPPGVGKTLLLRLVARRTSTRLTPVHVPYSALAALELARWVLHACGESATDDAIASFDALAARTRLARRPLLLLVDEANHLPPETERWLAARCEEPYGMRAVFAFASRSPARDPKRLRVFAEPLALAEVIPYVRAQLARAGAAAEVRASFSGEALQALALASEGLPRQIQRLADASILARARGTAALPPRAASPARSVPAASSAPRSATEARETAHKRPPELPAHARRATHLAPAAAGALFLVPLLLALPGQLGDAPRAPLVAVPLRLERPFDAALRVDGRPISSTLRTLSLAPGLHELTVEFADGRRASQQFVAGTAPLVLRVRSGRLELSPLPTAPPEAR